MKLAKSNERPGTLKLSRNGKRWNTPKKVLLPPAHNKKITKDAHKNNLSFILINNDEIAKMNGKNPRYA